MLKDFVIKEMKNLKCYDDEDNEVKCFVNVGNIIITDTEGTIAKLEFSDRRNRITYDGRELEMDGTIYRIAGDVLLEDLDTNKQYKGKFKASNAILVFEAGMMVTLNLLKTKNNPKYTIELIKEIEENQNKTLEENVESLVQSIKDEIIEELKNTNDTGKIKRITIRYDDNMENLITTIYQPVNLEFKPASILINESDLLK